ncbi:GAF domain-containing protein [Acidisoma cellulosilytica]|uniref:histidine kinase n=1 Tax=Acidisoma cellulosilyticum TaxID=2802395 RepID=A0A964E483_9PROT|nr:HWE histidine kinase domain-containing protein [Acidisoma cellulosilyticum]MCB8881204.1 GAF domain-containing protein [Acidisoma cellulosilyticum]
MKPPIYTFDADRLAALANYAILDSPAEPAFDGIVQLAAQICETPVSLVSLVADDRQWFKARVGFAPCETDLNRSVCAHALVEPDLLIIPDLTQDPRSEANPLVTADPFIRFYAGAPFHAVTGEVLGSLCVIDTQPRPAGLTALQADGLRNLARQVSILLDMRRAIAERDVLAAEQRAAEARRLALAHLGDRLREMSTLAEMTRLAARIVGEALSLSRVGFHALDEGGFYRPGEADWIAEGETEQGPVVDPADLRQSILRGKPLVTQNALALHMPVRERGHTVAVLVVQDHQPRDWSPEVLAFLRNVTDRLESGLARLKADAEQQVLNHELSHRLKNTFAMIQAIATQTLRAVPDQEPIDGFLRRLHALSAAHDVLLQQKWTAASMTEVVESVINLLEDGTRFDIAGPEIVMGPKATLSLSLLLHELTTNAMKYGSLSRESGRIVMTWQLDSSSNETELALHWRELGGPPAAEPSRRGFGSRLIRTGLLGNGGVKLHYLTSGFEAEFRAPLAQVQLS